MKGTGTIPVPFTFDAMTARSLTLLLCCFGAVYLYAGGPFTGSLHGLERTNYPSDLQCDTLAHKEDQRVVGTALAVLLGPFGAHRLYLGTNARVAVIYGLTFGGFGILPLIDLIHLIGAKDIAPYRNNQAVFMWRKPATSPTPP
jgi:TM2 domain-containing membrane protein YozV